MTMIPLDTHKAIKDLIDSGLNEKQAETFIGVINDIYANEAVSKAELKLVHNDLKLDINAVKSEVSSIRSDLNWIKTLLLGIGAAVFVASLKYIFS
ncbi:MULTISPECIES: hypothetical protein [Shewanella]|nr:hypothetical protein [Shewanella sp. DC2-4]AEH16343.1 hypothetical protein Sbal117_4709 [Shewanella baltica OS117]NRD34659.1 hypothetical protein [Shewanella sp. DC2-4]